MTIEIRELAVAAAAGMLIGLFYFGGLWLTVRRLPQTQNPGFTFFISFLIRMGVALLFFYVVMGGRWERLAASVLGFLIMRQILIRRLGPQAVRAESNV